MGNTGFQYRYTVSFSLLKHYRPTSALKVSQKKGSQGTRELHGQASGSSNDREEERRKNNFDRNTHLPYQNPAREILRIAVKHACRVIGFV